MARWFTDVSPRVYLKKWIEIARSRIQTIRVSLLMSEDHAT